MDGLTAARRIRAYERFDGLPIIATTAHALADDRANCLAAGMQDYLSKPLDVAKLLDCIAHWTGHHDVAKQQATAKVETPSPSRDDALADRHAAIQRMGGMNDLYLDTLRSFSADQAYVAEQLREALEHSAIADAHRLVHTLKGTAAMIGATRLHDAALAFESKLKAEPSVPDDWATHQSRIKQCLHEVQSAIHAELDTE
jgi:two-component system, sensor histidine kinase and response regulator